MDVVETESIDTRPHSRASTVRVLQILATIGALVLVSMRWCLRLSNPDTLLGPVMSVQNLTVYYWGQDRLVNLVPALAFPFRTAGPNFFAQAAVTAASYFGLIAVVVLVQVRAKNERWNAGVVSVVVLLTGVASLLVFGRPTSNVFLFEQLYALAYLLLFGGCLLLYRSGRRMPLMIGASLVVVAEALNPSVVLFAPVVCVLALMQGRRRRSLMIAGVFAVGEAFSVALSKVFGMHQGEASGYTSFHPRRMLRDLPTVMHHLAASVRWPAAIVIVVASIGALALEWRSLPPWLRQLYGLMVLFVVGWILLFSGTTWVRTNGLHFRYFFPVHLLFVALMAGAIGAVVQRAVAAQPIERFLSVGVALGALALAVWAAPGVPSIHELDYVRSVQGEVSMAEAADVRFVIGSYAPAWSVVFSMLTDHRQVFGITFRGDAVANDVRAQIADLVGSGQPVRALCLESDPATCAADFSAFVGTAWQVESTLPDAPSVVVLTPNDV